MDPRAELKAEAQKEKILDSRLSLAEKDKLFAFCQDKDMVSAIEKAMLYSIYIMGTIQEGDKELLETNWAYGIGYNTHTTNENLGQALRSKIEGLTFLSDAFKQIRKFGDKPAVLVEAKNPAL